MNVGTAIRAAEKILPGVAAPEGQKDPRWLAIIKVGEYVETDPEPIWQFTIRWGSHSDSDLRMAIATCLLEHLLQFHFDLIFPRVYELALHNPFFADTFMSCCKFDQSKIPRNSKRMDELEAKCRKKFANKSMKAKS